MDNLCTKCRGENGTIDISHFLTTSETPTFHSNIDALVCGELRLHQHIAGVFSFVHILLDVKQLQRAIVFEGSLSVVVRQQIGVFVPLDGIVRVTNDTTVDVHVPPSDGSEVFHWSDAGRSLKNNIGETSFLKWF